MAVVDRGEQAVMGADGTAEVRCGPVPPGKLWRLTRVTVAVTPPGDCQAWLYRNAVTDQGRIEGTSSGASDTDVLDPPLQLREGESVVVRWEGGAALAGAACVATFYGAQDDARGRW